MGSVSAREEIYSVGFYSQAEERIEPPTKAKSLVPASGLPRD
jgi:hypothetical protein